MNNTKPTRTTVRKKKAPLIVPLPDSFNVLHTTTPHALPDAPALAPALPFTIPSELCHDVTPKEVFIATARAAGGSLRDIGLSLDTHKMVPSRALEKPSVRAIVDYCHEQLLQHAYKQSVQNVIGVIKEYETPAGTGKDGKVDGATFQRKEHGFRASMKMLESIGLLPSGSNQSITIQQFNTSNVTNVSPVVDAALRSTMLCLDGESDASDGEMD
jgi:hypothetical protein